MSAYICNRATFVALARFATALAGRSSAIYVDDIEGSGTPAELVAHELAEQNIRSVSARYGDESVTTLPGYCDDVIGIRVTDADRRDPIPKPIAILKIADCLEYQSCETDDWHKTKACEVLNRIRKRAVSMLPGYDAAPWGL